MVPLLLPLLALLKRNCLKGTCVRLLGIRWGVRFSLPMDDIRNLCARRSERTINGDMTSAPAAAPQRPLLQLPTELVHEIALHLSPADLCHLESSCRRLFDCIRSDETLWRALAERRWGPLQKTGKDWRSVLCWLETDVLRTVLRTSVRRAIDMMALAGLLASAGAWTVCVRRLLDWTTLASRRRLAAFVCADWQPREMFRSFLELFDLRAPTPEAALHGQRALSAAPQPTVLASWDWHYWL